MRTLTATLVMLALGTATALGDDTRCMYRSRFFSPGDVSCQGGAQYRCVARSWQATGLGCADTTGDEEGLQVDPSRRAPTVRDSGVNQPPPPAVPGD